MKYTAVLILSILLLSSCTTRSPGLKYDKQTYSRLNAYLKENRVGMRMDDFLADVGIKNAEYTIVPGSLPPKARNRLYHFNGFYMIVCVECILPSNHFTGNLIKELHERNEVKIYHFFPALHIDGLTDSSERTKRHIDGFIASRNSRLKEIEQTDAPDKK